MIIPESLQLEVNPIINLFSGGDFQEAIDAISDLDKKYPNQALLMNIKGACHAGLGQFNDAIIHYNHALLIQPNYSKAHFNLGGVLHEIGKLDDSIKSYESSIAIDPDYPEAHNNLGNVQRELGDYINAIKSYENALANNNDYIEARYSLAITLQQIGNLESIRHFEKIITLKPDFAEAHNNLGVVFKEINQLDEAVESYKNAININPKFAEAHNNLGNALRSLGELNDAVKSFESAIKIKPDYPVFHNNLGNTLKDLGELKKALLSYQESLDINPDYPDTLNNIGIVLYELGELNEAIKSYDKAISIEPEYAEAFNNLGTVYKDQGKFDDAVKSYEKAIKIEPEYVDAFNNLGVIFKSVGRLNEAIKSYNQALFLNPDNPDTLNNLGNAQSELELLDESILSFKRAIKIKPDFVDAYNNLGISYFKLDLLDDAYQSIEEGLIYKSDDAQAYITKGRILSKQNKLEKALENFEIACSINAELKFGLGNILQTKMRLCHWQDLSSMLNDLVKKIENNKEVILPFDLLSLIDDPELQYKSSKIYANFEYPSNNILPPIKKYAKHEKIKIGYFSADFKDHPVATLTAELYELHDRSQFEIHAFSFGPDTNDEMNLRIKDGVDYFHEVQHKSEEDIALLARSIEVDIAVDLSGFTAGCRTKIFSMRAAPLQLSYIGLLASMGAEYYDYLVAGEGMIPEENQKFFSEKIVYLPSYQVNDSKETLPDITFSRKDFGLPEDGFVFCCFNNTYKITPTTFDSWARILDKVEGSVLMIYVNNEFSKNNLTKEIILRGVDPKRLIFGDNLPRPEYLARYRVADLFLDTAPYNAGTTASDALRMGLPVLTYRGNSFNSREASGVISALHLPELITDSQQDYESMAVELANNPLKLKKITDKLIINLKTAPLYDTQLFTKNLESAYKTMYERHHQGLQPEHINLD
jgi:protein O-GlcNAc transferase